MSPRTVVVEALSRVHGVLCSGEVTDEWVRFLHTMHMPAVGIGRINLRMPLHCVAFDFRRAAEMLTLRLHERGCERVGLVVGAHSYIPAQEMYAGYEDAHRALGRAVRPAMALWWVRGHPFEDMREFFTRQEAPFDGLVVHAHQDFQTFAYEHGDLVHTPLLGVLGQRPIGPTALRRIEQAIFEPTLGEAALELLFRVLNGTASERLVLTEPRLFGAEEARRLG